jgi:hypothetical protein
VSQDDNISPIKNYDELNQDETTSQNNIDSDQVFNQDESEQLVIEENNNTDENFVESIDSIDQIESIDFVDSIDSIDTSGDKISTEFVEPLQEQNEIDKNDFTFDKIEQTDFLNDLSNANDFQSEEETSIINLTDESKIDFADSIDETDTNGVEISTEIVEPLQGIDEIEALFTNTNTADSEGINDEFDNLTNGKEPDFGLEGINDNTLTNDTNFPIEDSANIDLPTDLGESAEVGSKAGRKIKKKKKKRKEKVSGGFGNLLSVFSGGKPIGVEGILCLIVFSILLLWILFMNFQAFFSRPIGVSSSTTIWYVALLNLFGVLGLLVPAWMFFNRGSSNDTRNMKDRNDVFRTMLGVGLIAMAIGVMLLMSEYFRYDFTTKAGDHKSITIIDGNSKIPEIKPNSTPEPLPEQ